MRADLDRLLTEAAGDPSSSPDVDELWVRGRRRRRLRHASALGGGLASVAALALLAVAVLPALGGSPQVEPMGTPPEESPAEAPEDAETPEGPEATAEGDTESTPAEDVSEEQESVVEDEGTVDEEVAAAAEPDPVLLEDPCGAYDPDEMALILDVVAPVDGQHVSGSFDLVGCASVYEGTVGYRLLDGDGEVLVEDFTTAECGGPCIGEYRDVVELPVGLTGPAVLQVYWQDASDGGDRSGAEVALDVS